MLSGKLEIYSNYGQPGRNAPIVLECLFLKHTTAFNYCRTVPRPPRRQELQTPKPLPTLPTTPQP